MIDHLVLFQEENDIGEFFMSLDKDPQQEDFLQGRMLGNPYSSSVPALGPLMRDVKNKICQGLSPVLFFLSFNFCRGEASHSSLRCRATFDICSIARCRWPFLSNFLPLPFLELSFHNPPISAAVFLVFCNLLASLSQIFSVISSLSFLLLTSSLMHN